jgi:hypothetical protein
MRENGNRFEKWWFNCGHFCMHGWYLVSRVLIIVAYPFLVHESHLSSLSYYYLNNTGK